MPSGQLGIGLGVARAEKEQGRAVLAVAMAGGTGRAGVDSVGWMDGRMGWLAGIHVRRGRRERRGGRK